MNRLFQILLFECILLPWSLQAQEVSKSALNANRGNDRSWIMYQNNDQALYRIIVNEAISLLEMRKEKVNSLETKEDWLNYQKDLKSKFCVSPEKFNKTPLNAKVTGKLERENFTVEKIVFESHPGFYVTSCMFLPKKRQHPAPAVIYCSGHTDLGFRSDVYQRVMLNLVEKGFIVFAFDPIGQGERQQYVNPETGKSKIGGSTTEHSYAGAQTLLTGTSLSDYFIWDGVRAVDYLVSRKEVDAKRIGITGRSGGGTQSAMIAACDDRIFAAAPECYITNFSRLLQSIGPQDAEQNPYKFIKNGMDHPDFIHVRAPKPTLIVTTTHDFFSQQGARETFEEVKKSYTALGHPENIQKVEDFGIHESTKKNREAVYAFFQKFLDNPGDNTDHEITPFKLEELWATPTGQVVTSLKGETIFSLNRKYFKQNLPPNNLLKEKVAEVSGIQFNRKMTTAVFTGKIKGNGYEPEKYFLENDKKDYVLPVFVITGQKSKTEKTLLWLPEDGKAGILNSEILTDFLEKGFTVISADLPGIGEMSDAGFSGDGFVQKVPFNYTFGANLIGKSVPGIQTEALDLLVQYIEKKYPETKTAALSEGMMSTPVLYFSILRKEFDRVVFDRTIDAYQYLVATEYYNPKLAYGIAPGSLSFFDFSNLLTSLNRKNIKTINRLNAMGEPLPLETVTETSKIPDLFE